MSETGEALSSAVRSGRSADALRLGVLASGRGTNLQAIIDASESGRIPARVVVVISDVAGARALQRASRHGIPGFFVDRGAYRSKADFEGRIVEILRQHRVDLVLLAGYMRVAGKTLISAFPGQIMNIHPALLPAFPGLEAQRQAWEYGVKISGCTVHFVDEGVDTGPIIIQRAVPVLEDDTPESLAERILRQEHEIYPEAIRLFAEGRLKIEGRRVRVVDEPKPAALLSVYDKTGIVDFARGLDRLGYRIVSTGGTARLLRDAGVEIREVSEVTGHPEVLDGRVKTLHPAIHMGILALRGKPEHMQEIRAMGISPVGVVACNLYPFRETISRPGVDMDEVLENIDIGGPTMIRAAAKNYRDVLVVVSPGRYREVLDALSDGRVDEAYRLRLAAEAFSHVAAYDALVAEYLNRVSGLPGPLSFPEHLSFYFEKAQDLRYGENPHQRASFYREWNPSPRSMAGARQIQGKELSYNNINDADAALGLVLEFSRPAAVAVKHANPCGCGLGVNLLEAFQKAFDSDPVSIFGGIVAVNGTVDAALATRLSEIFLEVIIAPSFDDDALAILSKKKDLRLLQVAMNPMPEAAESPHGRPFEVRKVSGGLLIQETDIAPEDEPSWRVVTKRAPTDEELKEMSFGMKVVKHVKSNAVVLSKQLGTVGIGPGQVSRIGALRVALWQAGDKAKGSVLSSDAFFPFPDVVEEAARAGVTAIVQPGGSVKDKESIEAADSAGIAMIFTGRRHFRH